MYIDFDRFEDYEDQGNRYPRAKGKPNRDNNENVVENPREESERKLDKFIHDFHLKIVELPEDKQKEKLQEYANWVERSLKSRFIYFDMDDIEIEQDEKTAVATHTPTLIYAYVNTDGAGYQADKKATRALSEKLEDHLKLWEQTSDDFKTKHGVL